MMALDVAPETILGNAVRVAADFSIRASTHDRSATFPHDNIQALFAAGLLRLPRASAEDNGVGCLSLAQKVIEIIAQGDASTALVLVNHYMVHAAIALRDGWPEHLAHRIAADNLTRPALVNALLAEPDLGSASRGGLSGVVASEESCGFRLNGRKAYVTGIPALSWLLVRARTDEATPRTGLFLVSSQAEGLSVVRNWDHIGMRASHSHEVVLTDVVVDHGHVVTLQETDAKGVLGRALMWWNAGLLGALYTGIVRKALAWSVDFLRARAPTNLGRPLATLPSMQEIIGDIGIVLDMNAVLLDSYARAVAQADEASVQSQAAIIKLRVVDQAADLTQRLLGIAGNAGLSAANPLERCHRDALCGRIHAPHSELVRRLAGQTILLHETR